MKARKNPGNLLVSAMGLVITLAISLLVALALIFLLSREPGKTIYYFFLGPFTRRYYLGNMLNTAGTLILSGLGIAIAFKASVFNLGGEGQLYAGALAATAICLALPGMGGYAGGLLALAGALALGALLAGLSGWFKIRWGTDELITSFLISSGVVMLVNYFITGPLDDPESNLLATAKIARQYHLLNLLPPSNLDLSVLFIVLAALLVFFLMYYTHWGYELRMVGLNREFSRYGGINVSTYLVLPMVLSGAFHGLAGGLSVLGTYHRALKGFSLGLGWNGIAVALIARNHPLGVVPAAVFFALLDAGAKAAMLHSDVTFEMAALIQSVIFYLVTAQAIYRFLGRRRRRA